MTNNKQLTITLGHIKLLSAAKKLLSAAKNMVSTSPYLINLVQLCNTSKFYFQDLWVCDIIIFVNKHIDAKLNDPKGDFTKLIIND